MKKTSGYDYPFIAYQIETEDGLLWCVEYPDVQGVIGGGKTKAIAIKDAEVNLKAYLDYLKKHKKPIPYKTSYKQNYSGRVTLRISKELHKTLNEYATFSGISLNSYINEALVEKVQKQRLAK